MTYAAPRHRSLIGAAVAALSARPQGRWQARLAAVAAKARQHVVTAAALGSVDLGVFHYGSGAGFIAVGLSLLVLDFAVTG